MTLNDFVRFAAEHQTVVILYFTLIPFAALLTRFMDRRESHLPPWNYLSTVLLYAVAIPAVLSVALSAYQWLVERNGGTETDLLLVILPVVSLIATALLIRSQVSLLRLPGFSRLSGMILMIAVALGVLWAVDRLQLLALNELPIHYLVLIFLILLYFIRRGERRLTTS